MPLQCKGKAEASTSHLFPAAMGLEHMQKWSLVYFFCPRALLVQPKPKWVAKKIHSWASYLAANTGFVSLSCYPGCSEKWEFGGHNSFHPKAAVQSRLSEISLELRDGDDTWLWGSQQEQGSSRTVGLTRAEMSWKQLNLKAGNNWAAPSFGSPIPVSRQTCSANLCLIKFCFKTSSSVAGLCNCPPVSKKWYMC